MLNLLNDAKLVEHLLGKPQKTLDESTKAKYKGKVVMVTGGGGSIGSFLCKALVECGIELLIIYEQNEFNLYSVDYQLKDCGVPVIPVLGDVCDARLLDYVMKSFEIDIVFHAAAYKHVPMVEKNPTSAVNVNVFGTKQVLTKAIQYGVKSFLLVSTDKAVNPTNIMGATKKLAEEVVLSQKDAISCKVVRFGNVLCSSGSVVPLFHSQLKSKDKQVTLTHPEVTRFFMSVNEAVTLILKTQLQDETGVYVLNMGEPVRIRDMIDRLACKLKVKNYEVVVTGLRYGEKLYEELCLGDGLERIDDSISFAREEPSALGEDDLYVLFGYLKDYRLKAIRQFMMDMVKGYNPTTPIVDPLYLRNAAPEGVEKLDEVFGDPNSYLWERFKETDCGL